MGKTPHEKRHDFFVKARKKRYKDAKKTDPKAVEAYEKQVNERMGK